MAGETYQNEILPIQMLEKMVAIVVMMMMNTL